MIKLTSENCYSKHPISLVLTYPWPAKSRSVIKAFLQHRTIFWYYMDWKYYALPWYRNLLDDPCNVLEAHHEYHPKCWQYEVMLVRMPWTIWLLKTIFFFLRKACRMISVRLEPGPLAQLYEVIPFYQMIWLLKTKHTHTQANAKETKRDASNAPIDLPLIWRSIITSFTAFMFKLQRYLKNTISQKSAIVKKNIYELINFKSINNITLHTIKL